MATKVIELKPVFDTLAGFAFREHGITTNRDLSTEGKQRQLASLQAERQAYQAQAVRTAGAAFENLLSRFNNNDTARKSAQERAASSWDYERLNYNAKSAEARVRNTHDISELENLYDEARESGDKHAFRALAEVATDTVRTHFSSLEPVKANHLINRMNKDLSELLDTAELKTIRERGSLLANEAVELKEALEELHAQYDNGRGFALMGGEDELGWMAQAIRVSHSGYDGFGWNVHVEIIPWQQAREQATGITNS